MKVLIVCASFNRPSLIQKYLMPWLPKVNFDWKVFVEPQHYRYYKQTVGVDNLVQTSNNIFKAGQLKQSRLYAVKHGYDLIFVIDDDMWFLGSGIKKKECERSFNEMLHEIVEEFEQQPNLGIVNIGSNLQHRFAKEGKRFVSKNGGCYGAMVLRTDLVRFKEGVTHYDDLALQLEAFEKGFYTYSFNGFYQVTPDGSYGLKGGFQSLDREALSIENFKVFKKLYPNIIEKVDTKNSMLDIDISWYKKNFIERS